MCRGRVPENVNTNMESDNSLSGTGILNLECHMDRLCPAQKTLSFSKRLLCVNLPGAPVSAELSDLTFKTFKLI